MRKVLIADDHEVTRRGIRQLMVEAYHDIEIGEASSAQAVIKAVKQESWDLLLLDIVMPGPTVLEVLKEVRKINESVPILIITGMTEAEYAIETIKAGANGLIQKHRATEELLNAIDQVRSGRNYLHSDTAIEIANGLRGSGSRKVHEELSDRELQVLKGLAAGESVKKIASSLGLSPKTIATYLSRIRSKTGLTTHVEIARYALEHGLVE